MGETDKYKYFKFTISVHQKNAKKMYNDKVMD